MKTHRMIHKLHRFRRAFTLIEMLIVIAIIGITTTMAVAVVSTAMEGDRFASSARTIQAALAGARDRAIRAKAPRGVRMFVEHLGNRKNVVTSMVYIGSAEPWRVGDIELDGNKRTLRMSSAPSAVSPNWNQLASQNLIQNGSRIRLTHEEQWYTVVPSGNQLTLTRDYLGTMPAGGVAKPLNADPNTGLGQYILELSPTVLPEAEPIRLSGGVAINLQYSQSSTIILPETRSALLADKQDDEIDEGEDSANAPKHFLVRNHIDIIFSPRGTIQGRIEPAGQILPTSGIIYFYLSDIRDITNGVAAGSNTAIDQLLVSVNAQTGAVHSFPVGPTGNILQYAQSGVTSAQ